MKFKRQTLITIAGSIWLLVGVGLLSKGLHLLLVTAHFKGEHAGPLLGAFMYAFTGALIPGMIFLVVLGLILGWLKSRFTLAKSAKRTIDRLYLHQGDIKLSKLYRLHDFLLVLGMIGLGRLMNWMQLPCDVHGLVDVAIGSALVNGAMIYFRYAIKSYGKASS